MTTPQRPDNMFGVAREGTHVFFRSSWRLTQFPVRPIDAQSAANLAAWITALYPQEVAAVLAAIDASGGILAAAAPPPIPAVPAPVSIAPHTGGGVVMSAPTPVMPTPNASLTGAQPPVVPGGVVPKRRGAECTCGAGTPGIRERGLTDPTCEAEMHYNGVVTPATA